MGWPLAVSAGLMERSSRALVAALWPLTVGHLLAMLLVILPFALLVALVEWQRQIQIGASLLVIGFGIFRLDQPAPSAGAGADTTDATGALVLRRGDRARRGIDARADLSRALPGRRPRQRPRGGRRAHQRQSRHGRPGLRRPLGRDDRGRRTARRGWSTATWVSSSCRGAGSIWMRPGPSASSWWALSRSRSALRTSTEPHVGRKTDLLTSPLLPPAKSLSSPATNDHPTTRHRQRSVLEPWLVGGETTDCQHHQDRSHRTRTALSRRRCIGFTHRQRGRTRHQTLVGGARCQVRVRRLPFPKASTARRK